MSLRSSVAYLPLTLVLIAAGTAAAAEETLDDAELELGSIEPWEPGDEPAGSPPLSGSARARILAWHEVMLDANVIDHTPPAPGEGRTTYGEQGGPVRTSRAFAIVQIAVHDAVVAIAGRYEGYTRLPPAAPGTSMDAAAARAAYETLVALYPAQEPWLSAYYAEDVATIPPGPAKDRGLALGHRAAAAILARRANDGAGRADPYWGVDFYLPDRPGVWQPDPVSMNPVALGAYWYEVEPFVMESADQFRVPPPAPLPSLEYASAYHQVKRKGGDGVTTPTTRTAEQTVIGIFWAYDGTPGVGAPPRHYNQIVRTILEARTEDPVQVARLLALANVAQADAGIAAWDSKYFYDYWRPVAGIREGDRDHNPLTKANPTWTPLGAPASNTNDPNFTPPFPAYPSGHAAFGSAALTTTRLFYGTDEIAFTHVSTEFDGVTRDNQGNVRPLIPRSFSTLSQAERENARSRIFLGTHWRFDASAGLKQGRQVARYVFRHAFRPVKDDGCYVSK